MEATWNDLLAQLEALGFYKYTAPDEITRAKARALETRYLYHDSTHRSYITGEEDLAECGVLDFFTVIEPFLNRQGIEITSRDEECIPGGAYTVSLNGKAYEIYSDYECQHAELWRLSTIRTHRIVNELLAAAGSGERVYLLYGGNDAEAVFQSPE